MKRSFVRQLFLVPSLFALLGFLFAVRQYLLMLQKNEPILFSQSLFDQLPFWLLWAFFSPLIFWLGRRFTFQKTRRLNSLAVHLVASVILAFVHPVIYLFLSQLLDGRQSSPPVSLDGNAFEQILIVSLIPGIIFYWLIFAVNLTFEYNRKYRDETLRAAELHARLTEARLAALRMQLQPHFLFNALHSITALVLKKNERDAVKMINRLGNLLRRTLENSDAQEISLEQEIEFLRLYLEIEQTRFADRLTIEISIEPATAAALVPNLILQPLVENAVRHGVAGRTGASRIEISARRENGSLRLEVRDDGRGLPENKEEISDGIGIKNTRERLTQLYGAKHAFHLRSNQNGGVTATLFLPFRRETRNKPTISEAR